MRNLKNFSYNFEREFGNPFSLVFLAFGVPFLVLVGLLVTALLFPIG